MIDAGGSAKYIHDDPPFGAGTSAPAGTCPASSGLFALIRCVGSVEHRGCEQIGEPAEASLCHSPSTLSDSMHKVATA
jgi:hypothetical protein